MRIHAISRTCKLRWLDCSTRISLILDLYTEIANFWIQWKTLHITIPSECRCLRLSLLKRSWRDTKLSHPYLLVYSVFEMPVKIFSTSFLFFCSWFFKGSVHYVMNFNINIQDPHCISQKTFLKELIEDFVGGVWRWVLLVFVLFSVLWGFFSWYEIHTQSQTVGRDYPW